MNTTRLSTSELTILLGCIFRHCVKNSVVSPSADQAISGLMFNNLLSPYPGISSSIRDFLGLITTVLHSVGTTAQQEAPLTYASLCFFLGATLIPSRFFAVTVSDGVLLLLRLLHFALPGGQIRQLPGTVQLILHRELPWHLCWRDLLPNVSQFANCLGGRFALLVLRPKPSCVCTSQSQQP